MSQLFIFSTPAEAVVTLTLDSGVVITGEATTKDGRSDAHLLKIPSGTSGGALLKVSGEGHSSFEGRGLLVAPAAGDAQFMLDDVHLVKAAPPKPTPPPDRSSEQTAQPVSSSKEPLSIINAVFATGLHSLATKEGCGRFTEACCAALHKIDPLWGHIKKMPGQNQFNGHAVDAIQLLGGERHGIYDIIIQSESPDAKPAFNRQGDANPALFLAPV